MLEKEKAIDAVLIATPDHLHAYVSITGDEGGQARLLREAAHAQHSRGPSRGAKVAKETGVATQMGNQGRSSEGHRQTVEWLKDGAIGAVREVHAWSGDPRVSRSEPGIKQGPARSRTASTGICGSARAPTVRTTASTRPQSGAIGPGLRRWHVARHGSAQFRSRVQCAWSRHAGHDRGHERPTSIRRGVVGSHLVT